MKYLFWISFLTLIYVYFGYPLFLAVYAALKRRPVKKGKIEPSVTVIIPAYNEQAVIEEKLKNLLSLNYPKEKIEIIVASDGSTDQTNQIVKRYLDAGVKLHQFAQRQGKPTVLNAAVKEASGEILVFSDASAILDRNAVKKIVRNFADSEVGCVCGDYKFGYQESDLRSKGEGLYVKYELFIKRKEAEIGSVLGLHGAIYAIRKRLYLALKANMLNDDYVISAKIVQMGFRSIYEQEALAYERTPLTVKGEFYRRMRIAAGNYQFIPELKGLLNPLQGIIFIEFISHKLLRTLTPFLLILLFLSNCFLWGNFYRSFFMLQLFFYLGAVLGVLLEKRKVHLKLFYIPYYFCLSNLAVIMGFFRFLTGKYSVRWQRNTA